MTVSEPFTQAVSRPAQLDAGQRPSSPLKIAVVTHYMPPHMGGIELVANSLYNAYLAAGHKARWIASRVPATADSHEGGRIRVRCWNILERKMSLPWPVWGPDGVRQLARLVEWADVVHAHDCLYMGSALAVLFAHRRGKPVLLTQHIGVGKYSLAALNAVERMANGTLGCAVLRGASHLVFATPAAEALVSSLLNGRPEAATTIPNGVDTNRFRPPAPTERAIARVDLGLEQSQPVVLFVGRLIEKKGIDYVAQVCRRLSSCQFLVVGDGPQKTSLPVSSPNLRWIPHIAPEEMHKIYRAADVFLLPSRGEGFPISVQEAMASGLPAVISKDEPYAAPLNREQACIGVKLTADAIAEAVTELNSNPELRLDTSRRARQMVERDWSLQAMSDRYLSIINDLAGSG